MLLAGMFSIHIYYTCTHTHAHTHTRTHTHTHTHKHTHLLELYHPSLPFLVTTQFKMFTPLQRNLFTELALRTRQTQHDLLRCLGFLMMNRSCLSTIALLFAFVPSLSLCECSFLCCLVLSDLVKGVFTTLLSIAKGLTGLRYVHHIVVLLLL